MESLVKRLHYTHEHGIFDAQIAGMIASPNEAADRIERLEAALVEAAIPLEAMNLSGAFRLLSDEMQDGITAAILAIRAALNKPA